jgi:hypothetical protein
VTSLTPSAGQLIDTNSNTYLVPVGCSGGSITISAADSLGLAASNLPSCWDISVTNGTATEIDNKTYSINDNNFGTTTINVTCGTSSKIITVVVYLALLRVYADEGTLAGAGYSTNSTVFGHGWWKLEIHPADAEAFVPTPLQFDSPAGYWPVDDGWPIDTGEVRFGNQENHPVTGFAYWYITFNNYISGQEYVENLNSSPGIYVGANIPLYDPFTDTIVTLPANNCTTQAVAVGDATIGNIGWDGIWIPWDLSSFLNGVQVPPPYASCQ